MCRQVLNEAYEIRNILATRYVAVFTHRDRQRKQSKAVVSRSAFMGVSEEMNPVMMHEKINIGGYPGENLQMFSNREIKATSLKNSWPTSSLDTSHVDDTMNWFMVPIKWH